MTYDKELRIQLINSRINLLKTRGETMNIGIIHKLEREKRKLESKVS